MTDLKQTAGIVREAFLESECFANYLDLIRSIQTLIFREPQRDRHAKSS